MNTLKRISAKMADLIKRDKDKGSQKELEYN